MTWLITIGIALVTGTLAMMWWLASKAERILSEWEDDE